MRKYIAARIYKNRRAMHGVPLGEYKQDKMPEDIVCKTIQKSLNRKIATTCTSAPS
jgi:hypothetical protein